MSAFDASPDPAEPGSAAEPLDPIDPDEDDSNSVAADREVLEDPEVPTDGSSDGEPPSLDSQATTG